MLCPVLKCHNGFPVRAFNRLERLRIVAKKYQATRGGHDCPRKSVPTPLAHSATQVAFGFEVVMPAGFFGHDRGAVAHAGGIIGMAFGEFLRLQQEDAAVFISQKIKKLCRRIVSRREPIGGAA